MLLSKFKFKVSSLFVSFICNANHSLSYQFTVILHSQARYSGFNLVFITKSVAVVHQMQTRYLGAGSFSFLTVIIANIFFGWPVNFFTFFLAIVFVFPAVLRNLKSWNVADQLCRGCMSPPPRAADCSSSDLATPTTGIVCCQNNFKFLFPSGLFHNQK